MISLLSKLKRRFTCLLIALTLSAGFTSIAHADTVIAIVDIQHILENASAAKNARDQIKLMREGFMADIKKKDTQLNAEEKELTTQRTILSAEAFEKKRQAFRDKQMGIQRDVQAKRAQLDKSSSVALNAIHKNIYEIISALAKERKFDIALSNSQILYANKTLDITNEVLTQLDKKLPKISVK